MQILIEAHSGRHLRVPSISSREAYQDMVDFADTTGDERLRELLSVALHGKGSFRRFKDMLSSYPEERERWFSFKYERMKERVEECLREMGIDHRE